MYAGSACIDPADLWKVLPLSLSLSLVNSCLTPEPASELIGMGKRRALKGLEGRPRSIFTRVEGQYCAR